MGRKLGALAGEGGAMRLVRPDVVPASEWLVHEEGTETALADIEEAAEPEAALRERYDGLARMLGEAPGQFISLRVVGERDGAGRYFVSLTVEEPAPALARACRPAIAVDSRFPSTKRYSVCHTLRRGLALSDRRWRCERDDARGGCEPPRWRGPTRVGASTR